MIKVLVQVVSGRFLLSVLKQLGTFVLRAINAGFQNGELSITQQYGLKVCIPKENKSRDYLKTGDLLLY